MKLSSSTVGSGPRHVGLVHGLGGNGATWQPLVDCMLATGEFTVTTLDLRGHGHSDRAPSSSLAELADDVVETLPRGLNSVVGHSLGGAVLLRAVGRLAPGRAIYLDPGFHLALPTTGIGGRLFWLAPLLSLGIAQIPQARRGAKVRAGYTPEIRRSLEQATEQFDAKMAIGIFREVAFHPIGIAPPEVASTVLLSDDSPAVLPDTVATALADQRWDIQRLAGIHHDMQVEDPARVFGQIRDLL